MAPPPTSPGPFRRASVCQHSVWVRRAAQLRPSGVCRHSRPHDAGSRRTTGLFARDVCRVAAPLLNCDLGMAMCCISLLQETSSVRFRCATRANTAGNGGSLSDRSTKRFHPRLRMNVMKLVLQFSRQFPSTAFSARASYSDGLCRESQSTRTSGN